MTQARPSRLPPSVYCPEAISYVPYIIGFLALNDNILKFN